MLGKTICSLVMLVGIGLSSCGEKIKTEDFFPYVNCTNIREEIPYKEFSVLELKESPVEFNKKPVSVILFDSSINTSENILTLSGEDVSGSSSIIGRFDPNTIDSYSIRTSEKDKRKKLYKEIFSMLSTSLDKSNPNERYIKLYGIFNKNGIIDINAIEVNGNCRYTFIHYSESKKID